MIVRANISSNSPLKSQIIAPSAMELERRLSKGETNMTVQKPLLSSAPPVADSSSNITKSAKGNQFPQESNGSKNEVTINKQRQKSEVIVAEPTVLIDSAVRSMIIRTGAAGFSEVSTASPRLASDHQKAGLPYPNVQTLRELMEGGDVTVLSSEHMSESSAVTPAQRSPNSRVSRSRWDKIEKDTTTSAAVTAAAKAMLLKKQQTELDSKSIGSISMDPVTNHLKQPIQSQSQIRIKNEETVNSSRLKNPNMPAVDAGNTIALRKISNSAAEMSVPSRAVVGERRADSGAGVISTVTMLPMKNMMPSSKNRGDIIDVGSEVSSVAAGGVALIIGQRSPSGLMSIAGSGATDDQKVVERKMMKKVSELEVIYSCAVSMA